MQEKSGKEVHKFCKVWTILISDDFIDSRKTNIGTADFAFWQWLYLCTCGFSYDSFGAVMSTPVSVASAVVVTAAMTNLNFCDLWSFPSAPTCGCLSSSDSGQIIQQISLVSLGVLSPKGHHSSPLCCMYHSEKLAEMHSATDSVTEESIFEASQ